MKLKYYLLLLFLTFFSLKIFAKHIVGGEIYYDYLGSNNYRITLKVYRDCNSGGASYDNPATIFIFNNAGVFIDSIAIAFPGSVQIPPTINSPCFTPPTNICVEECVYKTIVNLPDIPGGYNITYQRCCRNNTILNLINPGDLGATYMAHISDNSIAPSNSSPRYNYFPPIFLCSDVPLVFNHSATDPDGDSLYYELCDPYIGLDNTCLAVGWMAPGGCPNIPNPPPISFVPWQLPYDATYPMSASPVLVIDHHTGLLTGTPNMIGQWVVGVCVSEYRNGILIDANKRDFQFNVVDCPGLPVASVPQQQQFCFGYQVNFTQNSLNANSSYWDFGDPTTTSDISNLTSPAWTYPDSGTYTVTLIINKGTLCADTNTSTFHIKPLLAPSFATPPGECIYSNSFDFVPGGAFMGNGVFNWNFGPHASPTSAFQPTINNVIFDSVGSYPVTFTINENGCTESYTTNVVVYPKPDANFGLTTNVACLLNPVFFVDSSIADTPLLYNWNFANGLTSTLQNPSTVYDSVGIYNVNLIIETQHGCKDTIVLPNPLTVFPSPIAGFNITPADTSIFYPDISMTDQSQFAIDCTVYWGDGTSSSNCDSLHRYTHPGTYTIMQDVVNAAGCHDTAYSQVVIRPEYLFWLPNAFTPNNDGLNDGFKPKLIGVHRYEFLIFNRWGEKIFETTNFEEGWNGCYQSKLCEQDVYVYKISFLDDIQKAEHYFIGSVTLVR
jgi:gliding motility-associated-like protein